MPKVMKKPKPVVAKPVDVSMVCKELQDLQRNRAVVLKSRNMLANRLQAVIAGTLGYEARLPEKQRLAKFKEASALIEAVRQGKADHPMKSIILTTLLCIDQFNKLKDGSEKEMVGYARQLPVMAWVKAPERRGFGELFLAIVIGETGDLSNYANPAKVWRRMGCAPWEYDGCTHMGATWRGGKEGKLPKEEWEKFGYSPRRRSIAYLIGEGIVKQNFVSGGDGETSLEIEGAGAGPYRTRYDEAKAALKEKHPEYSDKRCHLHGMLLATKRLLRDLWIRWHGAASEKV